MTESIKFYLTWEEYFAAQEFFRRTHQAVAPEWVIGGLLLMAGVTLMFGDGIGVFAAGLALLGLIVIFAGPRLRRLASNRKWVREPLFETEHEVSFNENGVYFRMGEIESNLDWKYYQRLMESPTGLMLVYGNDSFNLLPKRAFADENLFNEFRSLATRNLHK
ncbi:MAG TPA: YcxB family protein [Blastocatellia bacterium]|nr:YcxB family protein [Blastocatellia bacterium]